MKNHYKNYSTIERERKVFAIVMAIIIVLLLALFTMEACGVFDAYIWKPIEEYPLANANISWEQTFYPGAWGT